MEYHKIDAQNPDPDIINRAAEVLRQGGIIVYPTDTLYGLGVDVNNSEAVNRLYLLKGRKRQAPVSLMVGSLDEIEAMLGKIPAMHRLYLKKLFPGKVTVLLKNTLQEDLPVFDQMESLPKIAFRIPDSVFCSRLSEKFGHPITTTSANPSGKANPGDVKDVIAEFGNKVHLIIDAGPLSSRSGSTIIDFTKEPFLIIREGDWSLEYLQERLPQVEFRRRETRFNIYLICSGNICRSPLAEVILNSLLEKTRYKDVVKVASAGTLKLRSVPAHELSQQVAAENNLDLSDHRSRAVSTQIMNNANLVVCMARNHFDYLNEQYPDQRHKVVLLRQWQREQKLTNPSIADPIGHGQEFFAETYKIIHQEIQRILPHLFRELRKFMDYNELQ